MSQVLLDTNVISELRKPAPHGAVLQWYQTMNLDRLLLPAIVFFELQRGVERTRRQDSRKAAEIDRWIDELPGRMHVIAYNADSAREAARLMAGKSPELLEDAMIAAIARVNNLTVATRNTKDFRHFDVPLVNPFEYKS